MEEAGTLVNEQPDRINSTEEGSLACRLILRRRESHWESRAKEGKGRRRFGFGGLPSPVSFQPATSNVASSSSEIKIGCRKLPPKRHFASLARSLPSRKKATCGSLVEEEHQFGDNSHQEKSVHSHVMSAKCLYFRTPSLFMSY